MNTIEWRVSGFAGLMRSFSNRVTSLFTVAASTSICTLERRYRLAFSLRTVDESERKEGDGTVRDEC
ncbi:hypothetical protein MTO96_005403 [Rhipicephalus appendiculatus]